MALVIALTVLLSVLVALNLALTAAIIRKLRRHDELLAGTAIDPRPGVGPGDPLPEFAVATADGRSLSSASLLGRRTVIAFVSTSCRSCETALPELREYLASATIRPRVVLVVSGDPDAAHPLARAVGGDPALVLEPADGPLHAALGIQVYPSFVAVGSDGHVERATLAVDGLPEMTTPAAAAP